MYNMAGTVEETIQGCSAFSPSHVDFRLRNTAWGNGARNTKIIYNYKWQSRSPGGQGIQGSCSLHAFLTGFFLPNLNDSLNSEWLVRREVYRHPIPTRASHQAHRMFSLGQILAYRNLWEGTRGWQNLALLTQLVLTLHLSIITSRLHSGQAGDN